MPRVRRLFLVLALVAGAALGPASVAQATPPANDDFPGQTLSGLPVSVAGTNVDATKQSGEPDHAGDTIGGGSVWYSWTAPSSGPVHVATCDPGLDIQTDLAVYTGSAVGSLTEVASNTFGSEAGCESSLDFAASSGTTYRIAVDGLAGQQGSFTLRLSPPPANDNFPGQTLTGLPTSITGSNSAATKEAGEPDHAGDTGGASVWYSWTAPSSGSVHVDTCNDDFQTLLGVYTGSAVNSLTEVASNGFGNEAPCESSLDFIATSGATYRIAVDGFNNGSAGQQGTFTLKLSPPPANDNFPGQTLTGLPTSATGSNAGATKETGEPNHAGNPGGASVWYSWTAPSSGPVHAETCGSNFNFPLLGVYTGSAVNSLTPVTGTRVNVNCPRGRSFTWNAASGTTYRIAVDGTPCCGVGPAEGTIHLQLGPAPANDDFPGQTLSGLAPSVAGTNVGATKQTGEPTHGGEALGESVWYSWTAPASGPVHIDDCDIDATNLLLVVYTGSAVNSLSEVPKGGGDVFCDANFNASAGTTYRIQIDADAFLDTETGDFQLLIHARPANDDFAGQTLTGLPVSTTGSNAGATFELDEAVPGDSNSGSTVWYSWTAPSSGPVHVDTCGSAINTVLGVYTGSAVNSLSLVASNDDDPSGPCGTASALDFTASSGTTYRIQVDGFFDLDIGPTEGAFNLELKPPPATDDFPGQTLSGLPASGTGDNVGATKETGEPDHAGNAGGKSVWYSWTAPSSGVVRVDTCASTIDTLLGVYTGSDVSSLSEVASNDDGLCGTGGNRSRLRFTASSGTTYRIAVDAHNDGVNPTPEGTIQLALRQPPSNDEFSGQTLTGFPVATSSSNADATKETGEDDHAGNPGGSSVWFSWTASANGPVHIDTCNAAFDTLLGVYTGGAVGSLIAVASNDDGGCGMGGTRSSLNFNAASGTIYRIAVDGRNGGTGAGEGSFDLQIRPLPANNDFPGEVLSGLPASTIGTNAGGTKQTGEPNHGGNAGGKSVWYSWTAPSSGDVDVDTCNSGFDTLLGVYTGGAVNGLTQVAANDDGGCGTGGSSLTFSATGGTTYRIAVDGHNAGSGADEGNVDLRLAAHPVPPPPPPPPPPAAATSPTGQRAAALKKCKKKKTATARRKCKTNANKLPI
jgi:hypothetical protein